MVEAEKVKDHQPICDLMSGTFRRPLLDDLMDLSGLQCEMRSSRYVGVDETPAFYM